MLGSVLDAPMLLGVILAFTDDILILSRFLYDAYEMIRYIADGKSTTKIVRF